MRTPHRTSGLRRTALVCGALLLASAPALAREAGWSFGIGAPGIQVGVTNAPPVWYPPQRAVLPHPVYQVHPPVVVVGQPHGFVVLAPYPYQLQPMWQPVPIYGHGWERYRRHHGHNGRQDFHPRGGGRGHDWSSPY